ncbi:protein disulfide isomerase-like 5-2 [Phragmites australis]|uniref:protein disulfide isomerase-like 5-2 n=1 Tax=Phragmites australis TaxID=29695 RepID=UPI002D7A21F2|nr:protein disulfide isomerase-like 5-2 [Phragmites australis]
MATRDLPPPVLFPLLHLLLLLLLPLSVRAAAAGDEFPRDGRVIELDESNFERALGAIDFLFVDFYAPWCGHCKRLSPELDEAAPVLAGLSEPIFVAKVNADKYRKLGSKYGVDGFPTLMLFIHGVPIEYTGSRKADQLVRNLKKFVAPNVSILESDSAIKNFVENAGTSFPIFLGFGVNESLIAEYGGKYKKRAWFAIAKGFSDDIMVAYDFDKVPALIAIHPKYKEQSLFYGPFEGNFLEDFVRQSLLPLTVPINTETLKMLNDDERKVVLAILEDDSDDKSAQLVKVLRSAANANRDLVFGYVGVKQWEEFVETFDISKSSQLPKLLVWDRNEEYELVDGSEKLEEGDQASQISQFLEGYRGGRTTKKKVSGPSFMGFLNSLVSMNSLYILIFVVALLVVMVYFAGQDDTPQPRRVHEE